MFEVFSHWILPWQHIVVGRGDGVVVRALASHQCDPPSIPEPGVMWVEFVVHSRPCSEVFFPGPLVFLPPQKPAFPNSNWIWNPRATGLSEGKLFSVTLIKQSQFTYFLFYCNQIWLDPLRRISMPILELENLIEAHSNLQFCLAQEAVNNLGYGNIEQKYMPWGYYLLQQLNLVALAMTWKNGYFNDCQIKIA